MNLKAGLNQCSMLRLSIAVMAVGMALHARCTDLQAFVEPLLLS